MSSAATTPRHPIAELLARYRAVLAAAWAQRHEMAGPQRLADEAAFLPAALSLQATPVHPAPRRAMWVIMGLFCAALVWSFLGQVDIVAVAPGRIIVSQRTKLIQPLEPAVVRAIHVRDGAQVQAGQVLVELDPTTAQADQANVREQRESVESELTRSQALLQALAGAGAAGLSNPPPRLTQGGAEVQALLQAEWQDIQAKRAKLAAEAARRQAEAATTEELITKLRTTLPLARQREANIRALAADGFAPTNQADDRTRERVEMERDLATQHARAAEAQAAMAESSRSLAAHLAETQRTLSDRAAQARLKLAQLKQEAHKSDHRERLTHLTAPVAGTVQQLAVHTTGGVVTAAQTLMVIVPNDGAEVTAEVVVDNKDIGFVQAGQHAEVKLETFNFTRYGTVPAQVLTVSADAVADERRGAIFPAVLKLGAGRIDVDGKAVGLAPGMNVTAEIKTGRRRVIEFLWGPLKQSVLSSGRER